MPRRVRPSRMTVAGGPRRRQWMGRRPGQPARQAPPPSISAGRSSPARHPPRGGGAIARTAGRQPGTTGQAEISCPRCPPGHSWRRPGLAPGRPLRHDCAPHADRPAQPPDAVPHRRDPAAGGAGGAARSLGRCGGLRGLLVAAITDYFDGKIARQRQIVSGFGRMLDPIADKLLVGAALMLLAGHDRLTGLALYPAILIMLREILVSGLREYLAELRVGLPVTRLAKWKTGFQMGALGTLLAGDTAAAVLHLSFLPVSLIGEAMLWTAAALTLVTGCGLPHGRARAMRSTRPRRRRRTADRNPRSGLEASALRLGRRGGACSRSRPSGHVTRADTGVGHATDRRELGRWPCSGWRHAARRPAAPMNDRPPG